MLTFVNAGSSAAGDAELALLVDIDPAALGPEICSVESEGGLSPLELPPVANYLMALPLALQSNNIAPKAMDVAIAGGDGSNLFFGPSHAAPRRFSAVYQAVLRFAAIIGLSQIQKKADVARSTLIGAVSTYNPYREGIEEGGTETASGELYDPAGWTAAIQTGLRSQFGGVHYGKLYQPTFALVASGEKRLIVKINDVGPLKPGRVLDLNERSMRYFDPFLARGILNDARIVLLPGENWTPGPVGDAYLIDFASVQRQSPPLTLNAQATAELEQLRAQFDHLAASQVRKELRADATPGDEN